METLTLAGGGDRRRVKLLCTFGGSILPRPGSGRLRHVGGDTRIVSVYRDANYDYLLARMRELFNGVSIIKYRQPDDEDLDALVSVVNDDDVVNMMEEYDKISGTADGFTRLRIFVFDQSFDLDSVLGCSSYFDFDEREIERRYFDALNSVFDSQTLLKASENFEHCSSRFQGNDSEFCTPRSSNRHCEFDSYWSPACFWPGYCTANESWEFSPLASPLSARFCFGCGECSEMGQNAYNYAPLQVDGMLHFGSGGVACDKGGFPMNLSHGHKCEHCYMAFRRNHCAGTSRKHKQVNREQLDVDNEHFSHFLNGCADSYRYPCAINQDVGMCTNEQKVHFVSLHNSSPTCGHGSKDYQISHRIDESGFNNAVNGGGNEEFIANDISLSHGNVYDGYSKPSSSYAFKGTNYLKDDMGTGKEVSNTSQTFGGGSHKNNLCIEENRYGRQHYVTDADSLYHVPVNLAPIRSLRRNSQVTACLETLNDSSGFMLSKGGTNASLKKSSMERSPRSPCGRVDDRIPHDLQGQNELQKNHIFEESVSFPFSQNTRQNTNNPVEDCFLPVAPEKVPNILSRLSLNVVSDEVPLELPLSYPITKVSSPGSQELLISCLDATPSAEITSEKNIMVDLHGHLHNELGKGCDIDNSDNNIQNDLNGLKLTDAEVGDVGKFNHEKINVIHQDEQRSGGTLKLLPELIASVKKAVLEGAEEAITKSQPGSDNNNAEADTGSDGDDHQEKVSKYDPLAAEADALAKGLQTIKNEDLEEIKLLGSGTYGSVYHGKWRGSDVAIKRMKDSCFEGKPSERERVISDFWKEALRMSSLHHPNIVSFYGIVCDEPDGSLATVTEFMVNGSLKQFIRKKDRTIDRRKRLIIAMDVAFGMEYLHAKNVIHFDLKCENLFVNMKDPNRPICKIGDFGLSKVKQRTLVSGGIRGTLPWMAPELLSSESSMVSDKIDVYSFGIVMLELLIGEEPYAGMHAHTLIRGIVNNTLRPEIPAWCDPEWKSLMQDCWSFNPTTRPSFREISERLRKMAAAINLK